MKDKEKYKNLVQIIGDLLKVKGNEWLIDEVLRVVGQSHPIDKIADYPLINEIYEHCIKEVIKKQADDFYSKFPIKDKELMDKLTCAFQEMEYNRRRDRFYEFSLNLNQQIEGITNYLFENKYKEEWESLDSDIKNREVERFTTKKGEFSNSLQSLINKHEKTVIRWSDLAKFKLVYYLMNPSYNKKYQNFFDWKQKKKLRQEISTARNEVHIGSESYDWQKDILASIKGNESRYYFKFYGFLADYIDKVESFYNPKEAEKEKKYSQKKSGNSHH